MKEIGGYFEFDDSFRGNVYHKNAIPLNLARNALLYILEAKNIRKIYIPYFLCNVVSKVLIRENIEFDYYHINKVFEPNFNKSLNDDEYLLIVNYYGIFSNDKIKNFKIKYNNIIVDNTHSFFQKHVENIDTIYSCRKFFGVPDGAYLYTDILLDRDLEIDCSNKRVEHIFGRYSHTASQYYELYNETQKSYQDLPLRKMSKLTNRMLELIDYNHIIESRNKNFKELAITLDPINVIKFHHIEGPFCYPLNIKNAQKIRKKLIENKVYIPLLWPDLQKLDSYKYEKEFVTNILPIPCDQRYNIKDMRHVLDIILNEM